LTDNATEIKVQLSLNALFQKNEILRCNVTKSVMMAQWDSSLSSPWPGFSSQPQRSISRDFSQADHTLPTHPEPVWQKMAQSALNDATQPVDSEEEGQSPTTDRRWLIEKNVTNKLCMVTR